MATGHGLSQVGYFDCAGGGQVVVENGVAFVGHMRAPEGTTIVDVRDPKNPKRLAELGMPSGTHSHKVRVHGDLMLINQEINHNDRRERPAGFRGGLGIYDVSDRARPRQITRWETAGQGVHRFDFDGRYAYISPTIDGYRGNIVMILDLADPARPREVGRWWMPGQWIAGGEEPAWEGTAHKCHHPLRFGDRLYTSYWHGGCVILDIADMCAPKLVSSFDPSPPYSCPTHTALPVAGTVQGRRIMLVADEDVHRPEDAPPAFLWVLDVSDERRPVPFASFQVEGVDGTRQPTFTACHQPCEKITGTEIPVAWFAHGLRIVDVSEPRRPREVAWFMPDVPADSDRVQSNDVTIDERGLLYVIDRKRGLTVLERT